MSRPWYAHYLGDYTKKTAHLTMLQTGAYRLLLDHYYSTERALPANAEQLHVICRAFADAERDATAYILKEFFTLKSDGYHNHRADEEIAAAKNLSKIRRNAAKTRYTKKPAKAPANAEQKHAPSQSQSHSSSVSTKVETDGEPSPKVNGKVVSLNEVSAKPDDPWKAIFQRGREVLKGHAGHQVALLRKLYDNKPRKVLAKIEDAAEQRDPPTWLYAFLHKVDDEGRLSGEYIGGVAPL